MYVIPRLDRGIHECLKTLDPGFRLRETRPSAASARRRFAGVKKYRDL